MKRGKEKWRKNRTKRGLLKEDVWVLFLWKPFNFLVKWQIWKVVVIFPGKTLYRRSYCEPGSCARVRVVPDVTDVLVSPSSVVTEFCDVSSMCSDREFVESQSFSFH